VRFPHEQRPLPGWDPMLLGTVFALAAAIACTAANICLRAVAHCDPYWVSCIKAAPTMLLAGGWLLWRQQRGQSNWPGAVALATWTVVGLVSQLLGNLAFQYALGLIGIAVTVPLTFGTVILSGAVLGRVWLGERIAARAAWAMALLSAAIVVLSFDARAEKPASDAWQLALGVATACAAGLGYALLGVELRRRVKAPTPLATTLFIISTTGFLSLGMCSLLRAGIDGLWATSTGDFGQMWLAGVFNAVAFLVLSKALEFAPVAQVNAVYSTQTAFSAVAGIFVFGETFTLPLAIGIAITIAGLIVLGYGRKPGIQGGVAAIDRRRSADRSH
jgi:drug/metabolite transporter, DME family